MIASVNRQVLLMSRPKGIPESRHFQIVEGALPMPAGNQVLVRNLYLSVEPAMRAWVSAVKNYSEPVPVGGVMRSFAVGRVEASRHPDYREGDLVSGLFGWQDYAAVEAQAIQRKLTDTDVPPSTALGVLGLNGVTAHYGLLEVGRPQPGETVVVSTAAGGVGSCVGQIAKLKGCRTVGIAGGRQKTELCTESFGFDAAVDYKAPDFAQQLAAACKSGVDVYFDNTAGPISDAVHDHLNSGARIVVCGTASVSSWDPPPQGPRVERHLLVKSARMEGFVIFDHPQHEDIALRDLAGWLRSGQLRYLEDVLDGIDQAPGAIAGLYRGDNLGKRLIRLTRE
jgi:NADPH-dependent curcumin reductase